MYFPYLRGRQYELIALRELLANNKLGNKSQLNNLINKETLNLDNEEDLYYIMKIITIMTRTQAIEVISKKETKDQGTEDLKRELEILKRGMKK